MFYLHPTQEWLNHVVKKMNQMQLKPDASKFIITFFSSMDEEFVDYFKKSKDQISSFSGSNVHIFTPMIADNNVIPDEDWRFMRHEFERFGVLHSDDPTLVFFTLEEDHSGIYQPVFFAEFSVQTFNDFPRNLRRIIDACVKFDRIENLTTELSEIFLKPNRLNKNNVDFAFKQTISESIPFSKLFISYSHRDELFVDKLINELSNEKSVKLWIDKEQINPGDNIHKAVRKELSNSDFLMIIISDSSTKSQWVSHEISQYVGSGKERSIIPVRISKTAQFPDPINSILAQLNYVDLSEEAWSNNIYKL